MRGPQRQRQPGSSSSALTAAAAADGGSDTLTCCHLRPAGWLFGTVSISLFSSQRVQISSRPTPPHPPPPSRRVPTTTAFHTQRTSSRRQPSCPRRLHLLVFISALLLFAASPGSEPDVGVWVRGAFLCVLGGVGGAQPQLGSVQAAWLRPRPPHPGLWWRLGSAPTAEIQSCADPKCSDVGQVCVLPQPDARFKPSAHVLLHRAREQLAWLLLASSRPALT